MRKLWLAALIALAACGGSTEPAAPWWQGTWNVVSMDGQAMPATLTNAAGLTYRYESMRVTLGSAVTGFAYQYSYANTVGTGRTTLSCSAFVDKSVAGDVVTLIWTTDTNATCSFGNVQGRTYTREGARMAHTWNGHRAVLERE